MTHATHIVLLLCIVLLIEAPANDGGSCGSWEIAYCILYEVTVRKSEFLQCYELGVYIAQ